MSSSAAVEVHIPALALYILDLSLDTSEKISQDGPGGRSDETEIGSTESGTGSKHSVSKQR